MGVQTHSAIAAYATFAARIVSTAFVLIGSISTAAFQTTVMPATPIGWSSTAKPWSGRIGYRIPLSCPPNGAIREIWGSEVYTDDSAICVAAVHAGLITLEKGGRVTIEIMPGQDSYTHSASHGVTSSPYGKYTGSYRFSREEVVGMFQRAPGDVAGVQAASTPQEPAAVDVVQLNVLVKDEDGKPINGAIVNVWQTRYVRLQTSALDIVEPFDFQAETDTRGHVKFQVSRAKGKYLAVQVARDNFTPGYQMLTIDPAAPTALAQFNLTAKNAEEEIEAKYAVKVRVHVVRKDDGQPVADAKITVWLNTPYVRSSYSGQTDVNGDAIITTKRYSNLEIVAYRPRFGEARLAVTNTNVSKTEIGPFILALERQQGTDVSVTVQDDRTHHPVSDAKVVVVGGSLGMYYSESTDNTGVAHLYVREIGTYKVRISQSFYEPSTESEIRILQGEEQKEIGPLLLTAKPKKEEGKDVVTVKVFAADRRGPDGNPAPLAGASVKIENTTWMTDSSGTAIATGTFEQRVEIRVEAPGYKPMTGTKDIPKLGRYSGGSIDVSAVLNPARASVTSPLTLEVDVRDATSNELIRGAEIAVSSQGVDVRPDNSGMNREGLIVLTFEDNPERPLVNLRAGLRLKVTHPRYNEKYSDITADLLSPSFEARRFAVYLERNWADLKSAIDALEPRVLAWDAEERELDGCPAAVRQMLDDASQAKARIAALSTSIAEVNQNLRMRCSRPEYHRRLITSMEKRVIASDGEFQKSLERLNQLAQSCKSESDAAAVKAAYNNAARSALAIQVAEREIVSSANRYKQVADMSDTSDLNRDLQTIAAGIDAELTKAQEAEAAYGQKVARCQRLYSANAARDKNRDSLSAEFHALEQKFDIDASHRVSQAPPALHSRMVAMLRRFVGHAGRMSYLIEASDTLAANTLAIARVKDSLTVRHVSNCNLPGFDIDGIVQRVGDLSAGAFIEMGAAADLPGRCANHAGVIGAVKPGVEALPEDTAPPVTAAKAKPAGGPLKLLPPEVKTSRRDPFGVGGTQYDNYTYGQWSATVNSVRSDGQVSFSWTFAGIPPSLTPGDTVRITVTGDFKEQPVNFGQGYRPMAAVEVTGMKRVSGVSPSMGHLSSGLKTSATSTYEFLVENTSQASITLYGDFGVGEIAVYKYVKQP